MSEEELILHRCCFTGHRPEKMKTSEDEIKRLLRISIQRAINEGYVTFITGMAPGVDIIAAETVMELKGKRTGIHLICALPYPTFCRHKEWEYNMRAKRILEAADLVKSISPACTKSCYQTRNIWMVDHSSLVIAVYNGTEGGTKNTIDYAEKKNKKIDLITVK